MNGKRNATSAIYRTSLFREIAALRASMWDLALLTWIPLLLLGSVAIQISAGVLRKMPIAVIDQDGGAIGRELSRRLDAAPGLHVAATPADMPEAEALIRSNAVYAVVLIPLHTARDISRASTGDILVFNNASYVTISGTVTREIGAVIQSLSARLAADQTAAIVGPRKILPPPVATQTTMLFNAQNSYELQLVSIVHPALLQLLFLVSIVGSLGRELRDRTIGDWIGGGSLGATIAAITGKLTPYLAAFMTWGVVATTYMVARGWPIVGSAATIFLGYLAMYLGFVGIALLFVGKTRSMVQSLSFSGLYGGAAFAFSGAVFPLEAASKFAYVWGHLVPYTYFAQLLSEQWSMGTAPVWSLRHVAVMLLFLLIAGAIGVRGYHGAANAPKTWGKR